MNINGTRDVFCRSSDPVWIQPMGKWESSASSRNHPSTNSQAFHRTPNKSMQIFEARKPILSRPDKACPGATAAQCGRLSAP